MKPFARAAFVALTLVWGSTYLLVKVTLDEISPSVAVLLRLAFASISMAAIVNVRRTRFPTRRRAWLTLLVLSVTSNAAPIYLIAYGERTVDTGVAATLLAMDSIFTLVIAHFTVATDRLTRSKITATFLGFGGVIVLLSHKLGAAAFLSSFSGQAALLGAGLCYSVTAVLIAKTVGEEDGDSLAQSSITIWFALLVMGVAVFLFDRPIILPRTPKIWAVLAVHGSLSFCVGDLLFFYLLREIGPTRTMSTSYGVTLVGILLGVVVLKENFDWRLGVGATLILLGTFINHRFKEASKTEPSVGVTEG